MAAIFVVALTIPEAWHDAPGGLDGPLVLVGAYLLVRCVHSTLSVPRLVATGVLVAALPAAIALPPLAGLAGLVLILAALVVVETTRYAQARRSLCNP